MTLNADICNQQLDEELEKLDKELNDQKSDKDINNFDPEESAFEFKARSCMALEKNLKFGKN